MAKAELEINVQAVQNATGYPQFQPGDMLSGTLTVLADGDLKCNHLYMHLEWHTEGRGSRFEQKVASVDLYQGTIVGGQMMSYAFSFTLPLEPWSYTGHYVSVVWQVRAQMDMSWAKDPTSVLPFVLRPLPRSASTPTNAIRW